VPDLIIVSSEGDDVATCQLLSMLTADRRSSSRSWPARHSAHNMTWTTRSTHRTRRRRCCLLPPPWIELVCRLRRLRVPAQSVADSLQLRSTIHCCRGLFCMPLDGLLVAAHSLGIAVGHLPVMDSLSPSGNTPKYAFRHVW